MPSKKDQQEEKDKNEETHNNVDVIYATPVMIGSGLEPLAGPVAEGMIKIGEKLAEKINQTTPSALSMNILDSTANNESHILDFEFRNISSHGIYIKNLKIAIQEPIGTFKEYNYGAKMVYRDGRSGLVRDPQPQNKFPIGIMPRDYIELTLTLPLTKKNTQQNKPYGVALFDCSLLNLTNILKCQVPFRLRWD